MDPAITGLVILGICLLLFLVNKLNMTLVAVGGMTAMVLFGVCGFDDAFAKLGSETVILMAAMMVVGKAAYETGLASLVGGNIVRLAGGSERMLCVVSTCGTALISSMLSNVATMAIMISIISAICESESHISFKRVLLPVGMGAVIGGSVTLVGSTPQLTAQGILESMTDIQFGFFDFTPVGLLVILLLTLYVGLIGYPISKRLWKDGGLVNASTDVRSSLPEGDRNAKIKAAVIFILTVVSFSFNLLPIAMTAVLAALACVLTGCIDHKGAMQAIEWDLCLRLAACLSLAEAVSVSGGDKLIAEALMKVVRPDSNPWLIFALLVFFSQTLTQFISNSTVIVIFLPIAISLCEGMGYNVMPFAVGITMASSMAVATPMANGTIAMALVAGYEFSDYAKYAGLMTVISYAAIVALVPLLFPFL